MLTTVSHRVIRILVLDGRSEHVVGGVPAGGDVADEHLELLISVFEYLAPGWEEEGGRVDDLVGRLAQL